MERRKVGYRTLHGLETLAETARSKAVSLIRRVLPGWRRSYLDVFPGGTGGGLGPLGR